MTGFAKRMFARDTLTPLVILLGCCLPAHAWRSSLYPEDWTPGYADAQGHFFHDFSYAGYHRGEIPVPDSPPGALRDVTQPPYFADPAGAIDATAAIQQALDDAGAAGGGIVYLPAGTYAVAPVGGNDYALRIRYSGVVLRGAGPGQTVIQNTATYMRQKEVIKVRPATGDWATPLAGSAVNLTADLTTPTTVLPVADTTGFAPGDYVVVRTDATAAFIADHGMTGLWDSSLQGVMFFREVVAIDPAARTLTLDTPTRYFMKLRDNARVYRVAPPVEESGVEHLSLSMTQNTTPGFGDNDYAVPGTGGYEVHNSHLLEFSHALNCWARDLRSLRHPGNPGDVHMLSMGILTQKARGITIQDCVMQKPLYKGGGGNGYMFRLRGNDCLYQDCEAIGGRHNYSFFSLYTSGNVVHRSIGRNPRYSSDFHGHLSMANLMDTMTMDGDWLQGVYRNSGTVIHGQTTTQSVYWNTFGTAAGKTDIVESRAWGTAYIIGTRGPRNGVLRGTADGTAPEDFLEGQGQGDTLEPESLYLDQLRRRVPRLVPHSNVTTSAFALSFDGEAGVRYAVEESTHLVGSHWLDSGYAVTGDGGPLRAYDPEKAVPEKYYRLAAEISSTTDPAIDLFTETIEPAIWNNHIDATTPSNGNVVVAAPTVFNDGNALRMYDLSSTDKPELQGDLTAPLREPFRVDFLSFNQSVNASSRAIRFRMANSGHSVGSEAEAAFSLSWQADGVFTARYEGGGGSVSALSSAPLAGVHEITLMANPAISGDYSYTLFGEERTLNPTSYDVYIDGLLLNRGFPNGLAFTLTRSAGNYDPTLGLGRFGLFGSSSVDVDPDYLYDNIILRRSGTLGTGLLPPRLSLLEPTLTQGFSFASRPGITYRIQWSTNAAAASPDWVDAGMTVRGNGDTQILFDPAGYSTSRVYRVAE